MDVRARLRRWQPAVVPVGTGGAVALGYAVAMTDGWFSAGLAAAAAAAVAVNTGLDRSERHRREADVRAATSPPLAVEIEFATADLAAVPSESIAGAIADWCAAEEAVCLASLHRERPPLRPHLAALDLAQLDLRAGAPQPCEQDLLAWEAADDAGTELGPRERLLLAAARSQIRRITDPQHETRRLAAQLERTASLAALSIGDKMTRPEDRPPAQYRRQVAAYLDEAEQHLLAVLLHDQVAAGMSLLRLRLVNPTDRNWERVKVEVHVPGAVDALDPEAVEEPPDMPRRPRRFGERAPIIAAGLGAGLTVPSYSFPRGGPIGGGLEIENGGSAKLRFPPIDLRPRAAVDLDPAHLLLRDPPGSRVTLAWSATCTNADGKVDGALTFRVAEPRQDPAAVVAEATDLDG